MPGSLGRHWEAGSGGRSEVLGAFETALEGGAVYHPPERSQAA